MLVSFEQQNYDTSEPPPNGLTVIWDLETGKRWTLSDNADSFSFAPDEKTVVVNVHAFKSKLSTIKVLEVGSGKELAKQAFPEEDRMLSLGPVSPDGAVVAISVGGKKGAPFEVWFLDARTLAVRGRLVGKGSPEEYWGGTGLFNKDGTRYIGLDVSGNILTWDVPGQKLLSTRPSGLGGVARWPILSPDGKTLAVGWTPKADAELASLEDPDPQDLPQPRVSLIDLTSQSPPRVLIAPHGYAIGIAFSPNSKMLAFGSAGAVHLFDLTK
jgi:WD40 repeat protein